MDYRGYTEDIEWDCEGDGEEVGMGWGERVGM